MRTLKQPHKRPVPAVADRTVLRPPSATSGWVIAASFCSFVLSLILVRSLVRSGKLLDLVDAAMICMGITAGIIFILDLGFLRVHQRESTGLNWSQRNYSWQRTAVKLLGLLGSLGFIGLLYWIFPEYRGTFYRDYWTLLRRILPWWLISAVPYFYLMDARQKDVQDGYYQVGVALLFRFRAIDRQVLLQHLLGWLVKGYFLALMFTYFVRDIRQFALFDFSKIHDFGVFFDFCYDSAFLIDVGFCSIGYLLSIRLFDTHLRSTEPTAKGWLVALVCYEPFWSMFSKQYFDYTRDFAWGAWLKGTPWLYGLWGSTILLLYAVYAWSTVIFGCRFSNLTHRGILTNGPYRWTKHPAYISKNLAWWLTFVPFVVSQSWQDSLKRCLMLLLLNGIYFLRAQTEEAHLRRDPVYVQYSEWMKRNGLFRWLRPKKGPENGGQF